MLFLIRPSCHISFVTLDHKISHKGQFFFKIDVWLIPLMYGLLGQDNIWPRYNYLKIWNLFVFVVTTCPTIVKQWFIQYIQKFFVFFDKTLRFVSVQKLKFKMKPTWVFIKCIANTFRLRLQSFFCICSGQWVITHTDSSHVYWPSACCQFDLSLKHRRQKTRAIYFCSSARV